MTNPPQVPLFDGQVPTARGVPLRLRIWAEAQGLAVEFRDGRDQRRLYFRHGVTWEEVVTAGETVLEQIGTKRQLQALARRGAAHGLRRLVEWLGG